jgi:hypothetical protein
MSLVLLFAAAASQPMRLVFRDTLPSTESAVTLGDVADLSILPAAMRTRAAAIVVARGTQMHNDLSHHALAAHARSLMPALAPWTAGPYDNRIRAARSARRPIMAVTARSSLEAGDPLTTRLSAGIFTIEREATALQSAREGDFLFVRVGDDVLKALCCGGEQ